MHRSAQIEHTADVALTVEADVFEELLVGAVEGTSGLLVRRLAPGLRQQKLESRPVAVGSTDREGLLFDLLAEQLYQHEVKGWIARSLRIDSLEDGGALNGRFLGRPFDADIDELAEPIKAVTLHGLRIEEGPPMTVTIVFDV